MNRLPLECDVIWFESKPRIDFKLSGTHPDNVQVFQGEDVSELLRKLVNAYAHLLVHDARLRRENKTLRRGL